MIKKTSEAKRLYTSFILLLAAVYDLKLVQSEMKNGNSHVTLITITSHPSHTKAKGIQEKDYAPLLRLQWHPVFITIRSSHSLSKY